MWLALSNKMCAEIMCAISEYKFEKPVSSVPWLSFPIVQLLAMFQVASTLSAEVLE